MIPLPTDQNQDEIKRAEVESLASLLEDPDHFVHEEAKNRLLKLGTRAIPLLNEYKCNLDECSLKQQIEGIIREINIGCVEQEFIHHLENGISTIEDLEKGIFILAKLDCPTLQTEEYTSFLDSIAERIKPKIQQVSTEQACRITLAHIFKTEKFQPTNKDYFAPANSYFNRVLKRRRGIPISLAMVVLFVGRRLNLPFNGVNMPMHFLVSFMPEDAAEPTYIDPFNDGAEVCLEQCIYFLKKCGIRPAKNHFAPASPVEMLARTLRNLINSYEKRQDPFKTKEFKRLLDLVETSQRSFKF